MTHATQADFTTSAASYESARRAARWGAAGWLLLILTLSLTPYDFDPGRAPPTFSEFMRRFASPAAHLPDVLANIALYAPLGALTLVAVRRRAGSFVIAAAITLAAAAAISLACETLQSMIPQRVCTVADTAANVIGAAIGLLVGGVFRGWLARATAALPRELRGAPLTLASKLLACVILLMHLWPYDAVATSSGMWRAVRQADVHPLHHWRELGRQLSLRTGATQAHAEANAAALRVRQDYALESIAEAAGYALLAGLTLAALRREYEFGRVSAVVLTLWTCLFIATIVTVGRMFLAARGLDTLHLVAAFAGACAGMLTGAAVARIKSPRGVAWRDAIAAVLVLALPAIYTAAREMTPLPWSVHGVWSATPRWQALSWLPLAGHFWSRMDVAVLDLGAKVLRYAVVGVGLGWLLRRSSHHTRVGFGIAAAAGAASLAAQVLHVWMTPRHSDLTNVLFCALGAGCGAVVLWTIRQYCFDVLTDESLASTAAAWDRKLLDAIISSKRIEPITQARVARRFKSDAPAEVAAAEPPRSPEQPQPSDEQSTQ